MSKNGSRAAPNRKSESLDFFWFFPTNGDVHYFGSDSGLRKTDNGYMREIAIANYLI